MYKLAEFRKKLEQKSGVITIKMPKVSSWEMAGWSKSNSDLDIENKNRLLNGVAALVVANGVIHEYESIKKVCKCMVDAIWLKKKIESTRNHMDAIAPIKVAIKQMREIHSQPR